jgi:hypothetical protein
LCDKPNSISDGYPPSCPARRSRARRCGIRVMLQCSVSTPQQKMKQPPFSWRTNLRQALSRGIWRRNRAARFPMGDAAKKNQGPIFYFQTRTRRTGRRWIKTPLGRRRNASESVQPARVVQFSMLPCPLVSCVWGERLCVQRRISQKCESQNTKRQ